VRRADEKLVGTVVTQVAEELGGVTISATSLGSGASPTRPRRPFGLGEILAVN